MNSKPKIYVLLGRTGDILTLLPAIEYEAIQNNYKPKLVVAKEYAEILDGCTYVEKVVFDGDFRNINHALRIIRNKYGLTHKIVNCSVYGYNFPLIKKTSSFIQEIWRQSKCELPQIELKLSFDNRNNEAEEDLINTLRAESKFKPYVILAGNGKSSPLWNVENIFGYFRSELEKAGFGVIDISNLKARRFYDLIGLYEKAHSLIAIDSAPLHLANATPHLPVISLISDNKDEWHRSAWRPNHILRVLYSEVPSQIEQILRAAIEGRDYKKEYLHVITTHKENMLGDEWKRFERAQSNWEHVSKISNYRWLIHFYRSSGIPKVIDMLKFASSRANNNDIIVISNADIFFHPDVTGQILHEVKRSGAVYLHRWDFNEAITSFKNTEDKIAEGKWYPGSDVFAFSKPFFESAVMEEFPDMYFAREAWDMVMRNLIKRRGGVEIHRSIYHQKHPSFWEAKENKNCKENLHNRSLAQDWLNRYGGDWNDWKYKSGSNKLVYKYGNPVNTEVIFPVESGT